MLKKKRAITIPKMKFKERKMVKLVPIDLSKTKPGQQVRLYGSGQPEYKGMVPFFYGRRAEVLSVEGDPSHRKKFLGSLWVKVLTGPNAYMKFRVHHRQCRTVAK